MNMLVSLICGALAAPTAAELAAVLEALDDRQRNGGDQKSLVYIDRKERDKGDLAYQAVVYRRDREDKLVILFLKPEAEAGKGYLRIDRNLFIYDPGVGKWERRTERERIGGTDGLRSDFDESRLAEEYTASYVGEETLGVYTVHHIRLDDKPDVASAWPLVELWIDTTSGNLLKRQDFAESRRLMRTTYYTEWRKVFSPSKSADVYYPREVRIRDEIETGNVTTVVVQEVDLAPLSDSLFTKAWLESKSR